MSVYQPKILATLKEICEEFRVGAKRVKAWVRLGAPIAREGEGTASRYSAESGSLQAWRTRFFGKGDKK